MKNDDNRENNIPYNRIISNEFSNNDNNLKSTFISNFSTSTNLRNIKKIDMIKLYIGYVISVVYVLALSFIFPLKLKIHDFTYKNKFLTAFFINNIYIFFTLLTIFKTDSKDEIKSKKTLNNEEFHFISIIIAILIYFESVFMLNSFDFGSNMSSILILYGGTNYFLSILLRYFFINSNINKISILFCFIMLVLVVLFHILYYMNSTRFAETSEFIQILFPIITGIIKSIYNVFLEYYYKEYREGFRMIKLFSLIGIYNFVLGPFFIMIKLIVTKDFNIFPNKDQIVYMTIFAVLPYLIFYTFSFFIVCYCSSEIYSLVIFTSASSMLTVEYFFTKDENFHWIIVVILIVSISMLVYELITYHFNVKSKYTLIELNDNHIDTKNENNNKNENEDKNCMKEDDNFNLKNTSYQYIENISDKKIIENEGNDKIDFENNTRNKLNIDNLVNSKES